MIGGLPGLFFFLMLLILVNLYEEGGEQVIAIVGLIFFGTIMLALLYIGV